MIKTAVIAGILSVAGLTAYEGHRLMEPTLWGKTIDEAFGDPRLAKLAHAACTGDADQVAALIKSGVPVDGRGYKGFTPLTWALQCKSLVGMEALLKGGANPNLAGGEGLGSYATLQLAARLREPSYLKLLLKYGANPSWRDEKNDPILFDVFAFAHDETPAYWDNYYMLIHAGADINIPAGHVGLADIQVATSYPSKAIELLNLGYKYDLDGLAFAVYASPMNTVTPDNPEPLRDEPEYPNLGILARMLRERGVDTEKAKARVARQDKEVGLIRHDFSFERPQSARRLGE